MSFWNLNDGSQAQGTGEYEVEGGDLKPIPANTGLIAAIEEAKWDSYEDDRYISLKWRVMRPEEFANRVIFHKIKVFGMAGDKDPKATADKAKRMLAAIDANAGGKLMKLAGEPSDMDLMSALTGKVMAIKVQVWKMKDRDTGEERGGNWISAVAPSKGGQQPAQQPAQQTPVAQQAPAQQTPASMDFEDDIPF